MKTTLTRAEMERVIQQGGSVLIAGQIITRVADLPSAADLAEGDPVAAPVVAADLEAQIAALQAQLAQVASPTPPATPDAPPEDGKTKKGV